MNHTGQIQNVLKMFHCISFRHCTLVSFRTVSAMTTCKQFIITNRNNKYDDDYHVDNMTVPNSPAARYLSASAASTVLCLATSLASPMVATSANVTTSGD